MRELLNVRFGRVLPKSPENVSYLSYVDLPVSSAVKELECFLEFCNITALDNPLSG